MAIRSCRDIGTSLKGSAFLRITYDGRTRVLREIPTLGRLERRRTRGAGAPSRASGGRGRAHGPSATSTR
jgi:hypothetical protein